MIVIMSLTMSVDARIELSKHKFSDYSFEVTINTVTRIVSTKYVDWSLMFAEYEYVESVNLENSTFVLTDKRILDDTFMIALVFSNEDRRVFFQNLSKVIRQAFYFDVSRQWRANIKYIVISNVKNHTFIVVVSFSSSNINITDDEIYISRYVNQSRLKTDISNFVED